MIVRDARNKIVDDYIETTFVKYKIDSDISGLVSVTPTLSNESTIEWKFTVNGASYAGNTIKEVGIFNSDGSVMLLRVNYDGIGPLTSADDIDFVIVVEVD